ncbi:MAG: helicase-exonuclease AddAB subunit AddA [Tepidisphaeraceae bacterium]
MTNWTPQQRSAIETTGKAVLVSAAAGSGKTLALAERCARLVCDGPDACDVDQLLVLTFTKAAAAEMRSRIDRVIRGRVESSDDPRLQRQLRLLDRANITTLDSYCLTVVRSQFHQLNIDPGFRLLGEDEARLLRLDVGTRLLDELYENDESGALKRLIDQQCNGDDRLLLQRLLRCHDLLNSVVDPVTWLDRSVQRWRDAAMDIRASEFGKHFVRLQQDGLALARSLFEQAGVIAAKSEDLSAYQAFIRVCMSRLNALHPLTEAGDWDTLAATVESDLFDDLPRMKKPFPQFKELAHEAINDARKECKEGQLFQLLRWDTETLRDLVQQTVASVEQFAHVVREFRSRFAQEKQRLRALDFGDIEALALRALNDASPEAPIRPNAAAVTIRQQFRHVLVDEYQDINPLQDAILQLLSTDRDAAGRERGDEPSNLFCVGDVKQSIYGFRLAEPNQFLRRQASLRAGGTDKGAAIDLQSNFRSRKGVIEAVNHVFRALMMPATCGIAYDVTHELRAGKAFAESSDCFTGKPVELHLIDRDARGDSDGETSPGATSNAEDDFDLDVFEREAMLIAHRIRDIVSPTNGQPTRVVGKDESGAEIVRPARYRDICVLLRSARVKASQAADLLREHGVPVHATDPTGFFTAVEVQDVLALLQVLSNGLQDIPLAALIRSPLSGIAQPEDLMARVRIAYPPPAFTFAEAVHAYAAQQRDAVAGALNVLLNSIKTWREQINRRPLAEGLDAVLFETRYLTFIRGLPGGEQRVANVNELRRRAEQFGSFERQGLDRFLRFIEDLQRDDDLGQPSVDPEGADVVRVMTVHRSKGLEFPIVIVPDLGKAHNMRAAIDPILLDRDLGIGMHAADLKRRAKYPTLPLMLLTDAQKRQTIAEEIRVLYVALTRAQEHLILIGSAKANELESLRKSFDGHTGPLPAEHVLRGRGPLHWLLPIAESTNRIDPGTFDICTYDEAALRAIHAALPRESERLTIDPRIKSLSALLIDPTPTDAGRAIERRLSWRYPFDLLATSALRRSMSATDEPFDRVPREQRTAGDDRSAASDAADILPLPKCVIGVRRASAADIGTATHAALQHVDFADCASEQAVQLQIERLIERRLLTPEQAKQIDIDSIRWFASTEPGRMLADRTLRHWSEQDVARRLPLRRHLGKPGRRSAAPRPRRCDGRAGRRFDRADRL